MNSYDNSYQNTGKISVAIQEKFQLKSLKVFDVNSKRILKFDSDGNPGKILIIIPVKI